MNRTSHSRSENRVSSPKARPHQQESLEDIAEILSKLPGLTYIFIASDDTENWQGDGFGPDIVSAAALLCAVYTGMNFAGPYDPPVCDLDSKAFAQTAVADGECRKGASR